MLVGQVFRKADAELIVEAVNMYRLSPHLHRVSLPVRVVIGVLLILMFLAIMRLLK